MPPRETALRVLSFGEVDTVPVAGASCSTCPYWAACSGSPRPGWWEVPHEHSFAACPWLPGVIRAIYC
jgi:hypothetical protein